MAANTAYASTLGKPNFDTVTATLPNATATRPSSAVLGYPGLPPVPLPRISRPQMPPKPPPRGPPDNSSEEEDRTDLLGGHFHVPRPKSRASLAVRTHYQYIKIIFSSLN